MKLAQLVKQAEGRLIRNERGRREPLRLLSPASDDQLRELERTLPDLFPEEIRELLAVTRGFENGPYEVDFSGFARDGQGLRIPGGVCEFFKVFHCALPIATDGCGNNWMIDFTNGASVWGPVFFACHDPPVFVFTVSDLREFIEEWLELAEGTESKLGRTFDEAVNKVKADNPSLISHEAAIRSTDTVIKVFAEKAGDGFQFIDLRRAAVGDGFYWGRVNDPDTDIMRDGVNLLFAIRKPPPKKPLLQRLFGK
jgi:hypothetical protein